MYFFVLFQMSGSSFSIQCPLHSLLNFSAFSLNLTNLSSIFAQDFIFFGLSVFLVSIHIIAFLKGLLFLSNIITVSLCVVTEMPFIFPNISGSTSLVSFTTSTKYSQNISGSASTQFSFGLLYSGNSFFDLTTNFP